MLNQQLYIEDFRINLQAEPILDFCGLYTKLCHPRGGIDMLSSGYERMNEKHLSMFSLSSRARLESRETCLFRGSLCFQYNFLSRARDFTTFTLHDLTVFFIIIHFFIAADQITK